jgi:predicted DNA-binding transcriptional regulator AlpA
VNATVAQFDTAPRDLTHTGHDVAIFKVPTFNPARWPRLMNRDGVAEYLSVSVRHVDVLVKQGLIPSPRFRPSPRMVRWDKVDIDEALDRRDQVNACGGKSFDEVMGGQVAMISSGKRGGR